MLHIFTHKLNLIYSMDQLLEKFKKFIFFSWLEKTFFYRQSFFLSLSHQVACNFLCLYFCVKFNAWNFSSYYLFAVPHPPGVRKYVIWCLICGGILCLIGVMFLAVYFLLRSYTSTVGYFETVPPFVPATLVSS
jgi:hypothetical protein